MLKPIKKQAKSNSDRSVNRGGVRIVIAAIVAIVAASIPEFSGADVVSFQEGVDGYSQTTDTWVGGSSGMEGASPALWAEAAFGSTPLIRFDGIFGNGPGQIPPGSIIHSAALTLIKIGGNPNPAADVHLHNMLVIWNESSNSSTFGGSVDFDDIEASSTADDWIPSTSGIQNGDPITFDVTNRLSAWSGGMTNLGWALRSSDFNVFASSEFATEVASRPLLHVNFTSVPEPASCFGLMIAGLALLRFRRVRRKNKSNSIVC